jgi:hypothetical protein
MIEKLGCNGCSHINVCCIEELFCEGLSSLIEKIDSRYATETQFYGRLKKHVSHETDVWKKCVGVFREEVGSICNFRSEK